MSDPLLFSAACDLHRESLVAYATRLTRNKIYAEDLAHDALLKAHAYWERFEPYPGNPEASTWAWFCRILVTIFFTQHRRSVARRIKFEDCVLDIQDHAMGVAPPWDPSESGLSDEVLSALAVLEPPIREVLERCDLREQSYREISAEMKIPIGTVMSRLHRARCRLAEELAGYAEAEYGIWEEPEEMGQVG